MRIWVTRSEPGASVLTKALTDAGYQVFKAPVLETRALAFELPRGRFDFAVFLSASGARFAAARLRGCFDRAFAVGRSTAAALSGHDVLADAAALESSEGLLAALPKAKGRRILLVTGVGGRTLLAPALRRQGAQVERLEVYERRSRTPAIDSASIDAILVSSGDGFRQAAQVWFESGGAGSVLLLAPSMRVGALAAKLGVANVIYCDGAGPAAVLDALRRMG